MAVNFIARKCACGGKLEFNPQKKCWICMYCGTTVEREATFDKIHIDGIEGISDVVRQTLMDIANNRMESAFRNLEDCERKGHKHVGTLIANISYSLSMISCAKSQDEARGHLDKVKIYAQRLQTEFPMIAEDEINLYEAFGEGVADIYANLVVVFDTLNDAGRVEYLSGKLKPEAVFSEYANKNLLKIAVKRNNREMVKAIINNIHHVDRKAALSEILLNYSFQDDKKELVEKIFTVSLAESLGKGFYEQYFTSSKDAVDFRAYMISKLAETNIRCNFETIVKSLYSQMVDYDTAKKIFSAIYEIKLSDQETEKLLVFCMVENRQYFVLKAFLDALTEKGIFVQLSSRAVISIIDSDDYEANEKCDILKKFFEFEIDAKSKDAIYYYFLTSNQSPKEERVQIADILLTEGCPITGNTVKSYVVNVTTDEENKIAIIDKIFNTGVNKTYLGDLLSAYLISSQDGMEIKNAISDYLINSGFKVDSNVLTNYVTSVEDNSVKVPKVKKLIANGTQVKVDCLESYILSISDRNVFSEELFNILSQHSSVISVNALANFLINCKDIDKARHAGRLLSFVSVDLNTSSVRFTYAQDSISGNVLQMYVLCTQDRYDLVQSIVSEMLAMKIKLNSEMTVNGSVVKFKKYAAENKSSLSPIALQICEENKTFSLF